MNEEIKAPRNNRHNHLTRDIKQFGKCPSCDEYHYSVALRSLEQAQAEIERLKKQKEIMLETLDKIGHQATTCYCDVESGFFCGTCHKEEQARDALQRVEERELKEEETDDRDYDPNDGM
jgi:hypothetical protein